MTQEKTYRIGEVAESLNLKAYVLRFWETEFPQISPLRTESGQRLYTQAHVNLLRRIKQLLHEQGLTIEGAKRILAGNGGVDDIIEQSCQDLRFLELIERELEDICNLLAQGSVK